MRTRLILAEHRCQWTLPYSLLIAQADFRILDPAFVPEEDFGAILPCSRNTGIAMVTSDA